MAKKIKFPLVIDVSSWKGAINWNDVHPRPDLVICQASVGVQERDDLFPVHWNNLKHMQIKRGAYHVFDPEISSQVQISNYLDAVEQAGGFDDDSISPILDSTNIQCNFRKTPLEKRIRQCLDEMAKQTGQTPIVLISRRYWSFLKDRGGNYPDWANNYYLWIPWYPSDPDIYKRPPKNTLPNGWEDWAIWKYDDAATVSGIKGYVSLNTLSESYAMQIGLNFTNDTFSNSQRNRLKFEATIVSTEGIIIRRETLMNSKMLAFLTQGSKLTGESVEFVNAYEAWLQVTRPVVGWCPIVHTGRIYLSIIDTH
jgi:GH25 family lysozyme M1 (1,4-beta-N-acetylmuramidase)